MNCRRESPASGTIEGYYLANQADIDAYLIRQSEKWAEGKRDTGPLSADRCGDFSVPTYL